MLKSICVFCGSNPGKQVIYREKALRFGNLLAVNGITLVYGGGKVGLMGALADGALEAGGHVIGVIPNHLMALELGHPGLTTLHVVKSMHERKQLMCDLADGFVALPGGFGTLDELCEILTWNQLGTIRKPTLLLNVAGYYDPFIRMLDHSVEEGFLKPVNRQLLLIEADETLVLDRLRTYQPGFSPKWLTPDER